MSSNLLSPNRNEPPERIWIEHDRRAAVPLAALEVLRDLPKKYDRWSTVTRPAVTGWRQLLFEQPPDVIGSTLIVLVRRCRDEPEVDGDRRWFAVQDQLINLDQDHWTVTLPDALLAARIAVDLPDDRRGAWAMLTAGRMLLRATGGGPLQAEADVAVAQELLASMQRRDGVRSDEERRMARKELRKLLPDDVTNSVYAGVIADDEWGLAVLEKLVALPDAAAGPVMALLRHLPAARGSSPAKKWLAPVGELLRPAPAREALGLLLRQLLHPNPDIRYAAPYDATLAGEANSELARAAIWATIHIDDAWAAPLLGQVAARLEGSLATAGGLALGRIGTPDAVAALQQLANTTRQNSFRKRVAAALSVAAEAAGLTMAQVVERNIWTGGLGGDGTLTVDVDGGSARIALEPDLTMSLGWAAAPAAAAGGSPAGWAKEPPQAIDPADVSSVKRQAKEVRTAVAGERRRVERLLECDRIWEVAEWRRYYLEHPITGRLGRGLIWRIDSAEHVESPETTTVTGIPTTDGQLQTLDGLIPLPSSGTVGLWHPIQASTDDVDRWRSWLLAAADTMRQPFKQAFREIYQVTDAERRTDLYSERFAGHVLRQDQLYALAKERVWVTTYLGRWSGGWDGTARRDFSDAGLSAVLDFDLLDAIDDVVSVTGELCSTNRIWFHRTADQTKARIPLAEIPTLVFSEAVRDIDLFVARASIALDPEWLERDATPYNAYWLAFSAGKLSATAEVRRDVLARLVPKLKVADRVQIDDRVVRVRGNLHSYKIHIGSGMVFMEPDDRALCIVARVPRGKLPMLPFDGDALLDEIFSKILFLAADAKIADPDIIRRMAPPVTLR